MPSEGKDFDRVFHPRGVAVVGASSNPSKFGFIFYYGLKNSGAPVYPVNPNEREVLGDKCYPTVDAIPHQVDYAVISIPAPSVPKVIEDCGRKGVKAVSIYTAGYGEEGTEEGRRRERELAETARRSGVRVIGPNCIGIYCPKGRLSFFAGLPLLEGEVGFLSQSGGHAEELAYKAENWGVRFSKIVSFGNACDVTPEELLEYLGEDPDTRIIGMYIEGSRNGRRFFEVLRRVAARKPVVVWKGGETEAGARAVASHTGSLAGSVQVWRAALRQAGALQVEDFEEMVDVLSALRYLPLPKGRRVAVVGAGGGAGV
ncbi:MAG: acetyl-CoA synthetase, partial [Hadesarchaea archaeon]